MLLRWLIGSLRKRDMVDARSWQLSASRKTGHWRSSEAAASATSSRDEILPLARIGATSLLCRHLPSRLPVILGMIVPAPGVVVDEKRVRGSDSLLFTPMVVGRRRPRPKNPRGRICDGK